MTTRHTSYNELYFVYGALVASATGRQWWRKKGIGIRPKGPYATIHFQQIEGSEKQVVEFVTLVDEETGEVFEQVPWCTAIINVEFAFFGDRTGDTADDAAHRLFSALYLEERYFDIWHISGLVGKVSIQDLSMIFRQDVESRVEVRVQIVANLVDPLPLAGTKIFDIQSQEIEIIHNGIDEVSEVVDIFIDHEIGRVIFDDSSAPIDDSSAPIDDSSAPIDDSSVPLEQDARIFFAPWYAAYVDPLIDGAVASMYDVVLGAWSWIGDTMGLGSPMDKSPVIRGAETWCALYSDFYCPLEDGGVDHMRLFTWDLSTGVRTHQDIWLWDGAIIDFYGGQSSVDSMDIHENGLIACTCSMRKDGGIEDFSIAIKVSVDKGATWKTTHHFPTLTQITGGMYYSIGGKVRIDDSGVIWVMYDEFEIDTIHVYKSIDSGDSWTLVSSFVTSNPYLFIHYTVDPTGQYQYITPEMSGFRPIYTSQDFGETWTLFHDASANTKSYPQHISNGQYFCRSTVAVSYGMEFSDDYGANLVVAEYAAGGTVDTNNDKEFGGYTIDGSSCGADPLDNYLGLLFTSNNGQTWLPIITPFPNRDGVSETIFPTKTYPASYGWYGQGIDVFII